MSRREQRERERESEHIMFFFSPYLKARGVKDDALGRQSLAEIDSLATDVALL